MPIIVKKEKKKINYFFYLSLLAFLLVVVWLVYSKWSAEKKLILSQLSTKSTFDATSGLADIKVEEGKKVVESPVFRRLSQYSRLLKPSAVGKSNPFSK